MSDLLKAFQDITCIMQQKKAITTSECYANKKLVLCTFEALSTQDLSKLDEIFSFIVTQSTYPLERIKKDVLLLLNCDYNEKRGVNLPLQFIDKIVACIQLTCIKGRFLEQNQSRLLYEICVLHMHITMCSNLEFLECCRAYINALMVSLPGRYIELLRESLKAINYNRVKLETRNVLATVNTPSVYDTLHESGTLWCVLEKEVRRVLKDYKGATDLAFKHGGHRAVRRYIKEVVKYEPSKINCGPLRNCKTIHDVQDKLIKMQASDVDVQIKYMLGEYIRSIQNEIRKYSSWSEEQISILIHQMGVQSDQVITQLVVPTIAGRCQICNTQSIGTLVLAKQYIITKRRTEMENEMCVTAPLIARVQQDAKNHALSRQESANTRHEMPLDERLALIMQRYSKKFEKTIIWQKNTAHLLQNNIINNDIDDES